MTHEEIRKELVPLINEVDRVLEFQKPRYKQFKKDMDTWKKRFGKAMNLPEKVVSMKCTSTIDPKLWSTTKLFVYLGLVESIG